MPANERHGSHAQLLAYSREHNLPPPAEDQLFLHKDGVDLLLVDNAAESIITVWADVGKVGDFGDEETLLSTILEASSQLNPLHGIFVGLDAASQRIMLRAKFFMPEMDAATALADFVARAAGQVNNMKASLQEELKR
jgi:hypothetical protein